MNITPQESLPTLLTFALETYAKPEVEGLCLELQDRYGGQVNILLWAAWLDSQGAPLDGILLEQGRAVLAIQERYFLRPLRSLRRLISRAYPRLRGVIKQLELRAEYWQLRRLQVCLPSCVSGEATSSVDGENYRLAYVRSLGVTEAFQIRVDLLLG